MKLRLFCAFFILTVLLQLIAASPARACSCVADPNSKKYLVFKKTWYGTKRSWTCAYTCQDAQQNRSEVLGTHDDWYMTDTGLEGVCDGLYYANTYLPHKQDFVWIFKEARWFSPRESSALELKAWERAHCR